MVLGIRELSYRGFVLFSTAFGLDLSVNRAKSYSRTRNKFSTISWSWLIIILFRAKSCVRIRNKCSGDSSNELICRCFAQTSYYSEAPSGENSLVLNPKTGLNALRVTFHIQY